MLEIQFQIIEANDQNPKSKKNIPFKFYQN